MEQPSFRWMTAAQVMGLDWTRGWPRVLTEYQVAQLQAMCESKDAETFEMDVARWKQKVRMAYMASVAEPCMVASLATDDGLPPIQLSMYTAEEFLKCCRWVGVAPSPYAQEWVESQLSEETVQMREDRWLAEFKGMGGTVSVCEKVKDGERKKVFSTGNGNMSLNGFTRILKSRGEKGFYDHKEVRIALEKAYQREVDSKSAEECLSDARNKPPANAFDRAFRIKDHLK